MSIHPAAGGLRATAAWQAMVGHRDAVAPCTISEMFAQDPRRATAMTIEVADLLVDLSRNRATPKTQSALLEAMQEHRVTIQGRTYKLEEPF